jgi:hypothetical protein
MTQSHQLISSTTKYLQVLAMMDMLMYVKIFIFDFILDMGLENG